MCLPRHPKGGQRFLSCCSLSHTLSSLPRCTCCAHTSCLGVALHRISLCFATRKFTLFQFKSTRFLLRTGAESLRSSSACPPSPLESNLLLLLYVSIAVSSLASLPLLQERMSSRGHFPQSSPSMSSCPHSTLPAFFRVFPTLSSLGSAPGRHHSGSAHVMDVASSLQSCLLASWHWTCPASQGYSISDKGLCNSLFAELWQVTASPFLQPGPALCIAQHNPLGLAVQTVFDPLCLYVSSLGLRILEETMAGDLLRSHKHPFLSPYPGSQLSPCRRQSCCSSTIW